MMERGLWEAGREKRERERGGGGKRKKNRRRTTLRVFTFASSRSFPHRLRRFPFSSAPSELQLRVLCTSRDSASPLDIARELGAIRKSELACRERQTEQQISPRRPKASLSMTNSSVLGANGFGELGDGTTVDRLTPVVVLGLTSSVLAPITTGAFHTCA